MADISKVTLPNNETYDLKDSVARGGIGNAKLFYGTCSSAAAATEKAVTCSEFTANDLVAGTMINVKFDNTNSGAVASLTLNVNGTGAKSIKYIYNNKLNNIPAAGYLLANNMYTFRYDGTNWVVQLMYNTDNNTTTVQDVYVGYNYGISGVNGYKQLSILMNDEQGLPTSLTTTSGTGTKTKATNGFQLGEMYYYNGSANVNAGEAGSNIYKYVSFDVDARYSFNCGSTLVAGKSLYLVGSIGDNGLFYLDDTWWTMSLPTSEDGKVYVLVGNVVSTTKVHLIPFHPCYVYKNGGVQLYSPNYITDNYIPIVRMVNTGAHTGYYYVIKLAPKKYSAPCFNIRLQDNNQYYDIVVEGYNYDTAHWGRANASLVSSSTTSIDVYFGYYSTDNLWVAVPINYYSAISVYDLVSGYMQFDSFEDAIEIEYASSLPETLQATRTIYRKATYDEVTNRVSKSGDTMTGKLVLQSSQLTDSHTVGALDLRNSNIVGINGIYFADSSDGAGEAINFYRDATHADSIHAYNGALYFTPNRELGTGGSAKRVIVDGSTFPEAYLSWGGRNFSASYGPIDATMVDYLGANRFAFLKAAGITVEYTRDNGETWIDYGLTDAQKAGLFSTTYACVVGKSSNTDANRANANCQLRVTIDTNLAKCYTVLNKFIFYVSTTGSGGSWASLDVAKHGDPNTWTNIFNKVGIGGWSGYNVINTGGITTYGNSDSQYQYLRFTFGIETQSSSYAGLSVSKIMAYGGVGWTTASNMATHGHLYSFDSSQNAIFPAKVTATEFSGTVATSNLSGTVPIANGGTGATTASAASNNLLSGLPDWTAAPTDDTKLVRRDTNNSPSFGQVKFSTIWSYIKSKADAVYAAISHTHTSSDISDRVNQTVSGGDLGWTSSSTGDKLITLNTLAYWGGQYKSGSSNLKYCNKGQFGNLAVKDSLTAAEVGAVPTSRTVNGKALSSNITLTASDVGALPVDNILTVDKGGTGLSSLTSGSFLRANSDLSFAQRTPAQVLSDIGALAASKVGAANGVAPLNSSSKIDTAYLPSYVDDVIEGYYYNSKFYTTSAHTTEISGETGKIFVDLSTNKTYRYSGSAFVEVSQGSVVTISRNLTSGTKVGTITIDGTGTDLYAPTNTDTKNTAGSTDTSSEIYLVGATSQAANPQTYSHDTARVRANGTIVSSGYEFATASAMGTTKAKMIYDSTLEAIAFQFD